MSEQSEKLPPHKYQRFLQSLPTDWDRKEIRQLGTVIGGGTPSRDVPSFWRGAIPWVTPGELNGNTTKFLKDTNEHISASGLAGSGANLLPAGSLMVTTRATLGVRAINAVPMATNQGFKSIIFKDTADAEFYFHLFEKVQPELVRRASGTTFLEISAAEFSCIEVPSPSSSDKCLITKILDTLDTAIHETEAIIAKLKAVKQGLLHDLLTRGIDANGELRPPHTEAPHLYKPSPLGWIPSDWDAVPLRKLVSDTYRYPSYYGINYVETGVPEVRGECVQPDGTLSHANGGYRYVSEKTASRFPRVRLNPGDLVMTVRGTIGKFALVPEWLKGAVITANLLKLSPDQKVVAPSWLMHVLLSSAFQDRLDAACSATTIKTIQVPALLDIRIATPLKTEQQEIGARLSAIDERLSVELMNLEKLNLNKRGLMDDLLTGRVRVTPLLAGAERAKECA